VRLFAVICFAAAVFYGYTAVEAMRTGATTALSGGRAELRRDVPDSGFQRILTARWLMAGGLVATGVVMQIFAARFDKLMANAPRQ
jgi:hypothetical protein